MKKIHLSQYLSAFARPVVFILALALGDFSAAQESTSKVEPASPSQTSTSSTGQIKNPSAKAKYAIEPFFLQSAAGNSLGGNILSNKWTFDHQAHRGILLSYVPADVDWQIGLAETSLSASYDTRGLGTIFSNSEFGRVDAKYIEAFGGVRFDFATWSRSSFFLRFLGSPLWKTSQTGTLTRRNASLLGPTQPDTDLQSSPQLPNFMFAANASAGYEFSLTNSVHLNADLGARSIIYAESTDREGSTPPPTVFFKVGAKIDL